MTKKELYKQGVHTPAHLYRDKTPYFITGAVYHRRKILTSELKRELIKAFHGYMEKFGWGLLHWVVLDNHYHLLSMSNDGENLSLMMNQLHSYTGKHILRETGCEKPVWWNYWDYCPRDDKDFYVRLNYLLYNPVKHGYVNDLKDYEFSSFSTLFEEVGREKLKEQFETFSEYRDISLTEGFDDSE